MGTNVIQILEFQKVQKCDSLDSLDNVNFLKLRGSGICITSFRSLYKNIKLYFLVEYAFLIALVFKTKNILSLKVMLVFVKIVWIVL